MQYAQKAENPPFWHRFFFGAALPRRASFCLCHAKIFSPRANQENLPSPYLTGTLNPAEYQNGALWELARGCPFKCAYCYESKGEKTVAYFPMERIRQELDFFAKQKMVQRSRKASLHAATAALHSKGAAFSSHLHKKNEEAFPNALNCATIKQQNFAEVMRCGHKAL